MGADETKNFDGLLHLLKASSKKNVVEICRMVAEGGRRVDILTRVREDLDLCESESEQLFIDLQRFLKQVTYHDIGDPGAVKLILPDDFHANLRELLTKIAMDNSARWRSSALSNQVSFPKVEDLSWEVDNNAGTTGQPTCKLNIKTNHDREVKIEMSKVTLDAMLDSLSTIRDQISSVAP